MKLTTKSRPRQSTSAGTPLWELQLFLGYSTSLSKTKHTQKLSTSSTETSCINSRWRGTKPLHDPVALDEQRHLLDAAQHRGGVRSWGQQPHQIGKRHHLHYEQKAFIWRQKTMQVSSKSSGFSRGPGQCFLEEIYISILTGVICQRKILS